jgi:hypothetical protein
MEKPLYEHDCDNCKFLGSYEGNDLYVCIHQKSVSLISRRSSDGPDYKSGMYINNKICAPYIEMPEDLKEVVKRAKEQGFIKE